MIYLIKKERNIILIIIGFSGTIVLALSIIMLFAGDDLDRMFNVIGIRIAAIFIAFAAFLSSMLFSLLILLHNRTAVRMNDDTNRRGELFREQQFASSNYSIIDFMDRMLIYSESERYVDNVVKKQHLEFHMIEDGINAVDIFDNPDQYRFVSIRIPFKILEGKFVSSITFDKLRFERERVNFEFLPPLKDTESRAFILYNEQTKRNNIIVNLIMKKNSSFYTQEQVNSFTKIKIYMNITSILSVKVKGNSELYFTNPEQIEGDGTNTYKINSSNFMITELPKIVDYLH